MLYLKLFMPVMEPWETEPLVGVGVRIPDKPCEGFAIYILPFVHKLKQDRQRSTHCVEFREGHWVQVVHRLPAPVFGVSLLVPDGWRPVGCM